MTRWTRMAPERAGYYWARKGNTLEIVDVWLDIIRNTLRVTRMGEGGTYELYYFDMWYSEEIEIPVG